MSRIATAAADISAATLIGAILAAALFFHWSSDDAPLDDAFTVATAPTDRAEAQRPGTLEDLPPQRRSDAASEQASRRDPARTRAGQDPCRRADRRGLGPAPDPSDECRRDLPAGRALGRADAPLRTTGLPPGETL